MVFTGSVQPLAETGTVFGSGDVADDSAIWVNPADPTQSFIIGESKATSGGLHVFNLAGAEVSHFATNAPIGNVDLSGNIVAAVNRDTNNVEVFRISDKGQLTEVGTFATGMPDVYGFTLGQSSAGKLYAFVSCQTGLVRQFDVTVGTSSVSAADVRDIKLSSITEGMTIDEAKGAVYIAQEDVALYRYSLDPSTNQTHTTVDTVGSNGIAADLEGVAIYDRPDGSGYVVVSSQGNSTFKVYDRNTNAFLGTFSVGASADGAVDAVTGSDGIEISSTNLGGAYSQGLFVTHDESNSGGTTSNYKLVPWSSIQALIGGATPPTPTNQAPVAGADTFTLAEDTVLTVPAPGVLKNDSDPDGDPLTAAVATGPTHGSLVLNADGSLTYTPALQYSGQDEFTYTVSDGIATATGTVNLTIDPVSLPSDEDIVGTRRADVLTSTDANEVFSGGKGGDTFVFDLSFGHDRITDFRAGSGQHDVIETDAFSSFDQLLERTSQVGADTVIAYDPDNTITLVNLQVSQLHATDFDFVNI